MAETKKAARKKPAEKKPEVKKEFEAFKARVVGGTLNIRSDASTDAGIVRVLPDGETVEVIGRKKDWYRISEGWIMAKFVEPAE